jgi:hypothetical protein
MTSAALQFELPAMPDPQTRFAKAWKESQADWDAYMRDAKREDGLLLPAMAARLIGVSRQRLDQLMTAERLTRFEHFDRVWLSRLQLAHWVREERSKGGRPVSKD